MQAEVGRSQDEEPAAMDAEQPWKRRKFMHFEVSGDPSSFQNRSIQNVIDIFNHAGRRASGIDELNWAKLDQNTPRSGNVSVYTTCSLHEAILDPVVADTERRQLKPRVKNRAERKSAFETDTELRDIFKSQMELQIFKFMTGEHLRMPSCRHHIVN